MKLIKYDPIRIDFANIIITFPVSYKKLFLHKSCNCFPRLFYNNISLYNFCIVVIKLEYFIVSRPLLSFNN